MDPSPYLLNCIALVLATAFNIVDIEFLIKANAICVLCYMFKL